MNFAKHVKIREEKFGAVIFETLREKVFVTNEIGKDILSLLEEGYPIDRIVADLANIYETNDVEIIKSDVISFINQLKDNHILTP